VGEKGAIRSKSQSLQQAYDLGLKLAKSDRRTKKKRKS